MGTRYITSKYSIEIYPYMNVLYKYIVFGVDTEKFIYISQAYETFDDARIAATKFANEELIEVKND